LEELALQLPQLAADIACWAVGDEALTIGAGRLRTIEELFQASDAHPAELMQVAKEGRVLAWLECCAVIPRAQLEGAWQAATGAPSDVLTPATEAAAGPAGP
jgi:hypothetical protein